MSGVKVNSPSKSVATRPAEVQRTGPPLRGLLIEAISSKGKVIKDDFLLYPAASLAASVVKNSSRPALLSTVFGLSSLSILSIAQS